MLDAKTLEWLKMSSACRFCRPGEECTGTPVSAESVGLEGYHYPHTECIHCRYFPMHLVDFRDAAEFEARVAEKLCDPAWNYAVEEYYQGLAFPYRKLPAEKVLKLARLEVEQEMIDEGNRRKNSKEK